jgi:hypothetical protein
MYGSYSSSSSSSCAGFHSRWFELVHAVGLLSLVLLLRVSGLSDLTFTVSKSVKVEAVNA